MEKGSGRLGRREEKGGPGQGGVFLLNHIPAHHNLQQYSLVLIRFRPSRSSPAKHLFNPKKMFNNNWLGRKNSTADGSLIHKASRKALMM